MGGGHINQSSEIVGEKFVHHTRIFHVPPPPAPSTYTRPFLSSFWIRPMSCNAWLVMNVRPRFTPNWGTIHDSCSYQIVDLFWAVVLVTVQLPLRGTSSATTDDPQKRPTVTKCDDMKTIMCHNAITMSDYTCLMYHVEQQCTIHVDRINYWTQTWNTVWKSKENPQFNSSLETDSKGIS